MNANLALSLSIRSNGYLSLSLETGDLKFTGTAGDYFSPLICQKNFF